jgi:hypothetical protein
VSGGPQATATMIELPDIGDPFDVEAWLPAPIPPEEDATPLYREALRHYKNVAALPAPLRDFSGLFVHNKAWLTLDARVLRWFESCQPALEVWQAATRKPAARLVEPAIADAQRLADDDVLEVCELVEVAELAMRRSRYLLEYEDALDYCIAGLRCARHFRLAGNLGQTAIAIGLENQWCRELMVWAADPRLPAEFIPLAIRRLADTGDAPPLSCALKAEYLFFGLPGFEWLEIVNASSVGCAKTA